MEELNSFFKEYEGTGVPYRGRCDDISKIVKCLSDHIPKHDDKLNKQLINSFEQLSFVKLIRIVDDFCIIKYDQGIVTFSIVPDELKNRLKNTIFYDKMNDSYCFSRQCHSVTSEYLELYHVNNIKAVTSICVNVRGIKYFHSYIWDVDNNFIIDFARNIVMNKYDYDFLFVDKEINVFDYNEYLFYMEKFDYRHCGGDYCRLLYLSLVSLYNEKNKEYYHAKRPRKTIGYYIDFFTRNIINKGL